MKQKLWREVKVEVCDHCGKEDYMNKKCLCCGVEHCYDCRKDLTIGIIYPAYIYCSGSGEGYFCQKCNVMLLSTPQQRKMDPVQRRTSVLHGAYIAVYRLQQDMEEVKNTFEKRRKQVEGHMRRVLDGFDD